MNCRAAQKLAFLVLFILSTACFASAQDDNQLDETINLNITQERVTETNYERSTEVKIGDAETKVSVRVGASVSAQTITINLRGITGNGRFRASLEKITQRIQNSKRIQD